MASVPFCSLVVLFLGRLLGGQAPGRQLSERCASTLTVTPKQAVGTWEEEGQSRSSFGAQKKTDVGPLSPSPPWCWLRAWAGPDLVSVPSLQLGGCVLAGRGLRGA